MEQPSYQATKKFAEWACSPSGMNGGNPYSDLWFCGIEFGGKSDKHDILKRMQSFDYTEDGIPSWGANYLSEYPECSKWQYLQKVAKVAQYYNGRPATDFRDYIHTKLARSEGETFLLNLYPLNFINSDAVNWEEYHYKLTGLPNKTAYWAWCMQYRFPLLHKLVSQYQPKVLICTGIQYENDFKLAFMEKESIFQEGKKIPLLGGKMCLSFSLNHGKTHMFVTPFFGRGINSDEGLRELAQIVKDTNECLI